MNVRHLNKTSIVKIVGLHYWYDFCWKFDYSFIQPNSPALLLYCRSTNLPLFRTYSNSLHTALDHSLPQLRLRGQLSFYFFEIMFCMAKIIQKQIEVKRKSKWRKVFRLGSSRKLCIPVHVYDIFLKITGQCLRPNQWFSWMLLK